MHGLKNIADRFVLSTLAAGERLASILGSSGDPTADKSSLAELLRRHERCLLEQSLVRHKGDVQAVMEEFSLPRRTLNEKMTRLMLERKDFT